MAFVVERSQYCGLVPERDVLGRPGWQQLAILIGHRDRVFGVLDQWD